MALTGEEEKSEDVLSPGDGTERSVVVMVGGAGFGFCSDAWGLDVDCGGGGGGGGGDGECSRMTGAEGILLLWVAFPPAPADTDLSVSVSAMTLISLSDFFILELASPAAPESYSEAADTFRRALRPIFSALSSDIFLCAGGGPIPTPFPGATALGDIAALPSPPEGLLPVSLNGKRAKAPVPVALGGERSSSTEGRPRDDSECEGW